MILGLVGAWLGGLIGRRAYRDQDYAGRLRAKCAGPQAVSVSLRRTRNRFTWNSPQTWQQHAVARSTVLIIAPCVEHACVGVEPEAFGVIPQPADYDIRVAAEAVPKQRRSCIRTSRTPTDPRLARISSGRAPTVSRKLCIPRVTPQPAYPHREHTGPTPRLRPNVKRRPVDGT